MKGSYKQLLSNRQYLKFLIAKTISRFGDSLDVVAYGIMVYQLTGSAALMASLYAVNTLPNIVLSVFSGTLVSYLPKRLVIFACDYGRGMTVLLTAYLFYQDQLAIWMIFAFTAVNSVFESFRGPAGGTLYQSLLKEDELTHAASLDNTVCTIAELIGYSSAALLIATLSLPMAIVIDGLTFFICGTIVLLIKNNEIVLTKPAHLKHFFVDMADGIRYFKGNRLILQICLLSVLLGLFIAPINALQVPYAEQVVGGRATAVAVLASSFMAMTIFGSAIAPSILGRLGLFRSYLAGGIGVGIGYSVMAFVALVSDIVMVKLIATPLGAGIAALLLGFLSLQTLFLICGVAFVILFISQFANPVFREMDKQAAA